MGEERRKMEKEGGFLIFTSRLRLGCKGRSPETFHHAAIRA
jgi:hypothetical protein